MRKILAGLFVLLALNASAIEGLRISVVQSNVVLGWPSQTNESFIVQWRSSFDTNHPWLTLTTNHLAATGTNWTVFTHTNSVLYPEPCPGSTNGGPSEIPAPSFQSSSSTAAAGPTLPPVPWDQSNWSSAKLSKGAASLNNLEPMDEEPECTNATFTAGFYRVVRTGVYPIGLATNQAFSGTVRFPVEIGVFEGNLPVSVTLINAANSNAVDEVTMIQQDEGLYIAEWDTAFVENGTFQLKARATFGFAAPYVEIDSPVFTVSISNSIVFPDPIHAAGDYLFIDAKSIHTNASYTVKIFGDPIVSGTNALLTITGTTSSEGYLIDDGYRGILLDATSQSGARYSGDGFRIQVQTAAAGGSGSTTSVLFKPVLPVWPTNTLNNIPTKFTIAYQPIFGNPLSGGRGALDLEATMRLVYSAANARPGGQGAEPGDETTPAMIWNQSDFSNWLFNNMRKEEVRNLFYFGHGSPSRLGGTNEVAASGVLSGWLSKTTIEQALRNNRTRPGTIATNAHPFRFVFVYGCNTANGDLPLAFGIPKKVGMKKEHFLLNGLRPQAYVGWKSWKVVGYANLPDTAHMTFIGEFFNKWQFSRYPTGHPKAGQLLGLKDALDAAAAIAWTNPASSPYSDLVIYGADDLTFDDFGDLFP